MTKPSYVLLGSSYWQDNLPICLTRERERFTLPYHRHDFVEIHWVAEGKGYHYIGEERLLVEKDDLFLIPVGTSHVYRPASEASKDELIVYNCLFSPEAASGLLAHYPYPSSAGALLDAGDEGYGRYRDDRGEVGALMEAMHSEYALRLPGYEALLHGQLIRLLVLLHRMKARQAGDYGADAPLARAIGYLNEHYADKIYVKDLAALVPVSSSHFQRLFKQATGQSLTEYVQNLRIRRSCELLSGTNRSVPSIAESVGYKDAKFFVELFRKKRGVSPRQYRRNAIIAP